MDIMTHYDAEIVAYALGNIKYYKLSDEDLKAVRDKIDVAYAMVWDETKARIRRNKTKR